MVLAVRMAAGEEGGAAVVKGVSLSASISNTMMLQWQRWQRLWPLLLAGLYLALIPVLMRVNEVSGVTYLLAGSAAACLLVAHLRLGRQGAGGESSQSAPGRLPWLNGVNLGALRRVPPVILWLPLPASLSWVAAEMSRFSRPSQADTYPAFGVWAAAFVVFVAIFLVQAAAQNRHKLMASVRGAPWLEVAAVAVITGAAFAIRFIDLTNAPGPFWTDEGQQAISGLEVARGIRKNLFDLGSGTIQATPTYALMALPFKVFGPSVFWARLPTAIVGTLTVPLLYLMLREMFDRRVALVGAAFLAVIHVHVHYSRMDYFVVLDVMFAALVLYFAFRAIRTAAFTHFALTGVITGLTFYGYAGTRVVPLTLLVLLAFMVVRTRGAFVVQNFWGLAVLFTGFVVAVLPAAMYFDGNSGALSARWEALNIYGSGWVDLQKELTGRSELHLLWDQFQQSAGALVIYKDTFFHYASDVPLLDGLSAVFLVVGGVYALFHLFQPRFFALYALLLLTVIFGGMLLAPPVQSQRLIATTTVSAAFVGVGLIVAADAAVKLVPRFRLVAPVAVVAVVAVIGLLNLTFYFGTFVPDGNFGRGRHGWGDVLADQLESYDNTYGVYILDTWGFNARDLGMLFRHWDKLFVNVTEDLRGKTYIEGRSIRAEDLAAGRDVRPNALFLVPIGRVDGPREHIAEMRTIEQACPDGEKSEVLTLGNPGDEIEYVWYEVLGAQGCVGRLQGTVLPLPQG